MFHIRVARGLEGEPTLAERLTAGAKLLRGCYPELRAVDVLGEVQGDITTRWQE